MPSPMYQAHQQPPMPLYVPIPRVPRHLQTLGVLWCVFGVYRIVGGLFGMFFFRVATMRGRFGSEWPFGPMGGPFGPHWMGAMLPFIATMIVVSAGLALLVGYSLLTRRPWGRTLAIIVGVLSLLKIPFGTALGIYTLWVLAPADSGAEYDSIADRT
ncbi:MAG TPA: hypothetical protein VNY78_01020 [Edaphobacter sp.]|nr:hypothetical protein [Edaphobacter sp.]